MYLVGGSEVTLAAYLSTLTASHGYGGLVQTYYNGQLLGEVAYESGSVRVTGRNRERRSIDDLIVAESLWPVEASDLVSPYGVWLTASVTVTAGATAYAGIPVFAGPVTKVHRRRGSGKITVSCADPMRQINKEAFERPRPVPAGALIVAVIRDLLVEVFPAATLRDLTGSLATVPPGLLFDFGAGSRGKAVDELAASIGAEVFALPTAVWPGGEFVIRPVPTLADAVAWTLPDGLNSVVVDDQLVRDSATVVNRWVVTSERTDAAPLYVAVTDDNPASATRYGGPMGRLPGFYSSPLLTSTAQMMTAGRAKLARSVGAAAPRSVTVVANPALEAGDVTSIGVDGEASVRYIADDFTVPFTHDPAAMTIVTRSAESGEAS